MKDYQKLALLTENQDFEAISRRLLDHKEEVTRALNQAILAAQTLDATVKKICFYGKPPKYSHVPLFDSRSLAGDEALRRVDFLRLLHGFMGIATEASEGLEALAKNFNGDRLDHVNVGEELGDIFWYSALIAEATQTSFEREQEKNIKKLSVRHGSKFNDLKVMDRDLASERKLLEEG